MGSAFLYLFITFYGMLIYTIGYGRYEKRTLTKLKQKEYKAKLDRQIEEDAFKKAAKEIEKERK